MTAIFNTLAFAKRLQDAGMSIESSEAIAAAIQDIAMNEVATKADIKDAVHSLTLRMGAMLASAIAVATAILGVALSH